MQTFGINLTALSVFGGALGVGLGFGLQKIASNFISGLILLFEKSIEPNDLIELADGTTGFIRRTKARYTLLETQDGRDVLIPNEEFISHRVISWTHSDKHARAEILVTISYGCDVNLARQIMLDAANSHPKRAQSRPSLCVLHQFKDFGIELLLYFWVADIVDGRLEPRGEIMQTIMERFNANGITIPYPQRELRVTNVTPNALVAAGREG
jgi:small-conductance mechanosensitive channel